MPTVRRSVALLGATDRSDPDLDVLRREPELFELVALSGGEQLGNWRASSMSSTSRASLSSATPIATRWPTRGANVDIVVGDEGLSALAASADIIVNAVLGFAGLPVTLSALKAGKRLALANKESLIAAAALVARVRSTPGATMLPVDSEHCAIHQCLASSPGEAVT